MKQVTRFTRFEIKGIAEATQKVNELHVLLLECKRLISENAEVALELTFMSGDEQVDGSKDIPNESWQ